MWTARAPVGRVGPAASRSPSSIIVLAPPNPSSPGWNIRITLPGGRPGDPGGGGRRRAASRRGCRGRTRASPRRPLELKSRPVSSWSGSASMSARRRTVGPGRPPSITATTELSALPRRPSRPSFPSSSMMTACVFGRSSPISGCRWIRRRIATTSSWIVRAASRKSSDDGLPATESGSGAAKTDRAARSVLVMGSRIRRATIRLLPWNLHSRSRAASQAPSFSSIDRRQASVASTALNV